MPVACFLVRGRIPSPTPKKEHPEIRCFICIFRVMGFEEDGRPTGGKKHAGGMFFSPGENPITDP